MTTLINKNLKTNFINFLLILLTTLLLLSGCSSDESEKDNSTTQNQSPIAQAGNQQTVEEGDSVYFDGTNSSDDTGITSYQWTNGNTILSNNSTFVISNLSIGIHTIILTVTDNDGATSTDTVIITIIATTDSNESIEHNGFTYNTITSAYTNRIWLDRNLGATKACTQSIEYFNSVEDYITAEEGCFGDYYQWGRESDGHEKSNSSLTDTSSNTITPNHSAYITNNVGPYDWTTIDNDGLIRAESWNPCPVGFRIPDANEVANESMINISYTHSRLKLPLAGTRTDEGLIKSKGIIGSLWLSGVYASTSSFYQFYSGYTGFTTSVRIIGRSVRCIKD